MKLATPIPLQRAVRVGQVSRAGFYRWRQPAQPAEDADMELRDEIQRIAVEWPCYGGRADHAGVEEPRLASEPQDGCSG